MNPNKKLRVLTTLGLVLIAITMVSAQPSWSTMASIITVPVRTIVCMLRAALVQIAGALAGLVFVFAGVKYLASADDPGKRKAAKDTMIHALIGLIIIAVANEIVMTIAPDFLRGC